MITNEQIKMAIQTVESCLICAPVDFLGTGNSYHKAEKEEREWRKEWKEAIGFLNEIKSLFTEEDLIDFHNFIFRHPNKYLKMGEYVSEWKQPGTKSQTH